MRPKPIPARMAIVSMYKYYIENDYLVRFHDLGQILGTNEDETCYILIDHYGLRVSG